MMTDTFIKGLACAMVIVHACIVVPVIAIVIVHACNVVPMITGIGHARNVILLNPCTRILVCGCVTSIRRKMFALDANSTCIV